MDNSLAMAERAEKNTDGDRPAPFLTLQNIRKSYSGVVALNDFSMEVSRGEVIGKSGHIPDPLLPSGASGAFLHRIDQ